MNPNQPEPPDDDPADPAPRRPPEPDAADCCGEGCLRCVHDVYEDALARYQRVLEAWRIRHPPA
ncbi:MAG: oxidoreductase-like domain-containing protein [Rhodanobacter sp.]